MTKQKILCRTFLVLDASMPGMNGLGGALLKAQELVLDSILLDIRIPGVNGLEVARHVRREEPKAKTLVMSQHDSEVGGDPCIDKSCLAADLLATMINVIQAHGAFSLELYR